MVPISSKRIKLSGAPSTGVNQSHSHGTMQNSSTNDQMQWKPRWDKQVWKGEFSVGDRKKFAIWWLNMFREWVPKSRDSNWKSESDSNKCKPEEQKTLDLAAEEIMENRFKDFTEERVW